MKPRRERPRPDQFAAAWSEQESAGEKAFVVILRTRGCAWARDAGCLMCGYSRESLHEVCAEDIATQVEGALQRYHEEPVVKIYTSGSFLDGNEIPAPAATLDKFYGAGAKRIVVESRPEFVEGAASVLDSHAGRLEVALGLETASDRVRERCVRKGFTFESYVRAAGQIRELGCSVRTYLLLKPLFLNERDAIADALASIRSAAEHSDVISINPVNVQNGTLVEKLWRRGEYRPPWLWSLVEALSKGEAGKARLVSSPSGGGTNRGAHNCLECDQTVLDAVRGFSMTGERKALEGLACECREKWLDMLALEPLAMTTVDLARISRTE